MGTESITVIVAVSLFLIYVVTVVIRAFIKRTAISPIPFILMLVGILFAIVVIYRGQEIEPNNWAEVLVLIGLLAITAVYAEASVKMAEEMREQRYDTVRPVIDIQREPRDEDKLPEAVAGKSGDTSRGLVCVLRNIGLGPAIDMHSFVQNPFVQNPSDRRQRFEFGTLAAGEKSVLAMSLSLEQEDSRIALVVYYKDVYGRTFESSREVKPDEEKSWQVNPLQIRPVKEGENRD